MDLSVIPMSNNQKDIRQAIRQLAQKLGFDLCRFARPEVPSKHASAYEQWLDAGMHGEMIYMAENSRLQRRRYPSAMLADVKTVICVGMLHSPPAYTLKKTVEAKGRGVIAAYAHGDDYHDVMKKQLKTFSRALHGLLGEHEQRTYVDTAPVLEHALAEAAGLGWQGKHSLTINRDTGSWMMLGEVFTTAEIEPDMAANNHCGTCQACMDVCPTKAIVAPYVVDARLCISYLTIEFKGFIPRALRPLMGKRIFGCDDCQVVCPWNGHAIIPEPDLLSPRKENILPELAMLMQLDDQAFRKRFRKSPVKRTGRARLLRNVCVAMGNSGDQGFVPLLIEALDDEEPLVRAHAAWALGSLFGPGCRESILSALEARRVREVDSNVLEEICITIEEVKE